MVISFSRRRAAAAALFPLLIAAAAPKPATPTSVLAAAPVSAWRELPADELMVIDLEGGGRVVVALAPEFAPKHVANITAMARAHYYDGLWVERVQDDYVAQWGDPEGRKPLPATVARRLPAEYQRPLAGLRLRPLPYRDSYAPRVGWIGGWPAATDGKAAWLTHCYGTVGVGRNYNPDTGTGAELYAVIGTPPRQLDRNIAVVGRVVAGIERLAALPRGTGDMSFYKTPAERLPIVRVRMADELNAGKRPRIAMLDPASPSFAAWLQVKANRHDDFYLRPAGAVDICNAVPPVKMLHP